jgi:hypothetical protein
MYCYYILCVGPLGLFWRGEGGDYARDVVTSYVT